MVLRSNISMLMLIEPLIDVTSVFFVGPDNTRDEYDDPFGRFIVQVLSIMKKVTELVPMQIVGC